MAEDRDKPATGRLVDDTLDDHKGCMEVVLLVEECLDRHPDDPGQWVAELRDRLGRLHGTLREHFEHEDDGPLFRELPERHPRLAASLAKLKAEHGQILADIEAARQNASSLEDAEVYDLRVLNAQAQLLIAKIRRHEAAENELVMQAYWTETGVGD